MSDKQVIQKKTNIRYFILAMLFIVTTFNYVDRATLSIAASAMRKERLVSLPAVLLPFFLGCDF